MEAKFREDLLKVEILKSNLSNPSNPCMRGKQTLKLTW